MELIARPIDSWPGRLREDRERRPSDFTAGWMETSDLLAREVEKLAGTSSVKCVLQLAITDRDLRNDGWIRSDAKPTHPGVIVSFRALESDLRFSTDAFKDRGWGTKYLGGWKANVRAIALGLEALRKVDRYGLGTGREQYVGWAQLGTGEPIALGASTMTVEEAARALLDGAHMETGAAQQSKVISELRTRMRVFREAARLTHPDTPNGSEVAFKLVNDAKTVLDKYAPLG